jgi:hypothetical protein
LFSRRKGNGKQQKMAGDEDPLRAFLWRLRRAARDGSFPVRPRITVGITPGMARELMGSLRQERIDPVPAVDGRGRPVYRLDLGDIVVEWLAQEAPSCEPE